MIRRDGIAWANMSRPGCRLSLVGNERAVNGGSGRNNDRISSSAHFKLIAVGRVVIKVLQA